MSHRMSPTWVYIQSETPRQNPPNGLYTVGHYEPGTDKWIPESDHSSASEAAARVHYLNGGSAPEWASR